MGGGGKTSLILALAEELRMKGRRVVTATTTKVWRHEVLDVPCVMFDLSNGSFHEEVRAGLETHGHIFVGKGVLDSGKVQGINPALADLLYQDYTLDYLILEADGAAGRPVKVPAVNEPVIPGSATMVVAMMGLDAIGKPLGSDVVFRLDKFKNMTGLEQGEQITPEAVAGTFQSPEGVFQGSPEAARRVVFLNKLDLLADDRRAMALGAILMHDLRPPADIVVVGSVLKKNYMIMKK